MTSGVGNPCVLVFPPYKGDVEIKLGWIRLRNQTIKYTTNTEKLLEPGVNTENSLNPCVSGVLGRRGPDGLYTHFVN